MANNVTISTLYLGALADLDTDETDKDMESPGSLIGTYGSVGTPLYKGRTDVVTNSPPDGFGVDDDNSVTADHSDNGTPDTISYDLGGGPVTTQIDSIALVTGTITFNDGTTLTDTFAVFQDQTGALFLTIYDSQATLDDKGVVSFQITSVNSSGYDALNQFTRDDNSFVPCFTGDARILTPTGPVPIKKLQVGDLVMTRDHGPQPIRWIGSTQIGRRRLEAEPNLRPYRIRADCFGPGLPDRDLTLSPQHRVLTGGKLMAQMFGEDEMLIAVKHLAKVNKVQQCKVKGGIRYRHILLDRHEVIYANGLPTETLLIGQEAHRRLPRSLMQEIEAVFPHLALGPAAHPPARTLARGHHGRLLTERLRRRRAHGRSHDATVIAVR
ncbi:Hint domain-containing protein [Pseudooceanicola onchidii]|uniref:Hint domain-containing protein n=1 Tax=Pseudooceanicola onchidii TaxID=2562279 RepID=UPI0010A9BE86|nr:Hint domain-containing protein [Pseudooceanicola onchidii]